LSERNEFSVCQIFVDGSEEYVAGLVSGEEAVNIAKRCTETVGAKIGTTARVIITDGGDCMCFEWKFGEGVTYPRRGADGMFTYDDA
jgi:hypothetical protein